MLVKRTTSSSRSGETILPTTCPSANRSASNAWPYILGAVVVTALLLTASRAGQPPALVGRALDETAATPFSERSQTSIAPQQAPQPTVSVIDASQREAPVSVMKCVDTKPRECKQWARAGECTRNAAFMHGACPESCNKCPPPEQQQQQQQQQRQQKQQQQATQRQPMPKAKVPSDGDEKCVDLNGSCRVWANAGECESNPGFMGRSCKRSCGMCSTVQRGATVLGGGE